MTIAPELPGLEEIVPIAKEQGVVLLMGHTDATYDQALHAMDLGVLHATHTFNAMSNLMHRNPGVSERTDEQKNLIEDILICFDGREER